MKKTSILILLALFAFGRTTWAQTVVGNATELTSAIANNANIQLANNITLTAHLTIPANAAVTIDLNGHTLSRNLSSATSEGNVITVANTGNLTLTNGTISGGWNSTNDGTHTAGGIVNKGTTTLNNVTISGCKGNDGGGIMNRGTLTITGGSISNNISTNHGGGGIVNYGTVNLSGSVSITENNCHTLGGGIWSNGTLEMEGNIQVKDNTKSHSLSNNVYLKSGHVIQVTGNLTGSVIGLSMEQLGTATSGLSGNGDLSCFFSDNPIGEELSLVDGEATLALYTDRVYYIERNFNNGEVTEQVKYVTEGNYTELAGSNGNVVFNLDEDGWYVVKGSCVRQRLVAPSGRGANLILCDGATLTSLIIINEDCKLNIYAQSKDSGKIVADATNVTNKGRGLYPAGIGSEGISHMGSLEIHGGDVSAYGSKEAAGIGGGGGYLDDHEIWAPNGGYVTIYVGSVKAYGGDFAAGIGDGYPVNTHSYPDYVSTLIVYGGNVYSVGGDDAAGIGGSSNNEKGGIVKVYGGRVEAQGGRHQATYEVEYVFGAGIGGGWYGNGGDVEVYGGEIYAYGGRHAAGIGSGYNGTNYGYAMEGVHSGTLTVFGGRVEATGGVYAAGIGGGPNVSGANVTVHGGTVIGIGGEDAAGIGSGEQQSLTINGGMLTVNGGIVEAHGGNHGAGIGGGQDASGATVEINGGEVRAFGGTDAAGIGSGEEYVSGPINGGSLTVNGGTVFADGSGWGAGIGGGDDADGATVVINGGSVTAWAGEDAGNKNGCAIGSHRGDNHRGTLEIDDDMMVHAGQNPTDANAHLFPSATRVPACFYRPYAKIELCDHQGATYTINGTDANGTHTLHCTHCLVSETHTHTLVDGVCTVRGVSG